jgi:hypothetical protein
LPSWTTVPGDQRLGIYYSGINTLLFITVVSEVGTIPLFFFQNLTLILVDSSSHLFSKYFGGEFVFLSTREEIWRVVAFNGILIYLPYLFARFPIISWFFLYWPNPPLYIYSGADLEGACGACAAPLKFAKHMLCNVN